MITVDDDIADIAIRQPKDFNRPCETRIGFVEYKFGIFLHFCAVCGRWGKFGHDVNLKSGRLGKWYCAEHNPE